MLFLYIFYYYWVFRKRQHLFCFIFWFVWGFVKWMRLPLKSLDSRYCMPYTSMLSLAHRLSPPVVTFLNFSSPRRRFSCSNIPQISISQTRKNSKYFNNFMLNCLIQGILLIARKSQNTKKMVWLCTISRWVNWLLSLVQVK